MNDTVIRAKVDPDLKAAYYAFCKEQDITPSQAIRSHMRKTVRMANKETADTLDRSEVGEDVYQAKDVADLFNQLDI